MSAESPVRCGGKAKHGGPCGGYAMAGSDPPLCYPHGADKDRLKASQKKGGQGAAKRAREKRIPLKELTDLKTAKDARDLINKIMRWNLSGRISGGQAQRMGTLVNAWLAAHKVARDEDTLDALRAERDALKAGTS